MVFLLDPWFSHLQRGKSKKIIIIIIIQTDPNIRAGIPQLNRWTPFELLNQLG